MPDNTLTSTHNPTNAHIPIHKPTHIHTPDDTQTDTLLHSPRPNHMPDNTLTPTHNHTNTHSPIHTHTPDDTYKGPSRPDNTTNNTNTEHRRQKAKKEELMEKREKKKEEIEGKTSERIGDNGKKEKGKETDREKMEGRKVTDNLLPVGGILRGNPFSCLPPGFGIGCPPLPETSHSANMSTKIPTIILKRPSQLRGDGKSFLQSTPLYCYMWVGKMDMPVKALTDTCSNVGLIDMVMFRRAFPRLEIRPLAASVSGVGTNNRSGFAVVPIRFDCTRNNAHEIVQADMEAHLVENFSPGT